MSDFHEGNAISRNAVREQREWTAFQRESISDQDSTDIVLDWKRSHASSISFVGTTKNLPSSIRISARITHAMCDLNEVVEIDMQKAHGIPVLQGTRFKISQILAEVAEGSSILKICRNFNLNKSQVQKLFNSLSIYMDRPFEK